MLWTVTSNDAEANKNRKRTRLPRCGPVEMVNGQESRWHCSMCTVYTVATSLHVRLEQAFGSRRLAPYVHSTLQRRNIRAAKKGCPAMTTTSRTSAEGLVD